MFPTQAAPVQPPCRQLAQKSPECRDRQPQKSIESLAAEDASERSDQTQILLIGCDLIAISTPRVASAHSRRTRRTSAVEIARKLPTSTLRHFPRIVALYRVHRTSYMASGDEETYDTFRDREVRSAQATVAWFASCPLDTPLTVDFDSKVNRRMAIRKIRPC